jgi:hypothetical protein
MMRYSLSGVQTICLVFFGTVFTLAFGVFLSKTLALIAGLSIVDILMIIKKVVNGG